MRFKIFFSLAIACFSCLPGKAQVCPNETDLTATNVCGLYGDAYDSYWNWELNDPLNSAYCANWYARTAPSGFLARMGSPFVNATTGKLKAIADDLDYTKAKGWELLQRKFGCQTDVSNPYFILYNKYTGMLRVYVFLGSNASTYSQLLMTIKSVYNIRPATISDGREFMLAPDKYKNNLAGTANDDIVISLNESVGSNQWAVSEFYMMLDNNIADAAYHNGSLQISIYGVTTSSLNATIQGTSNPGPLIKDGAFKPNNAPAGGSTFNFTGTSEKLINFSKSLTDFITALNTNSTKVYDAFKNSADPVLKKLSDNAKVVKDNTTNTADFAKVFTAAASFLGIGGEILKFAGAVIGFFKGSNSSAATPSYTSYNLVVKGTISAQVVVQQFVIKIPGTSDQPTNRNNATFYTCPMGIFNLKTTPKLDTLTYNRAALLPNGSSPSGVPSTIKYTAYKLSNNVEVIVNGGAGLTLVSVEGALMAKVVNPPSENPDPANTIWISPLENYPKRGYYTYFNHMRADIEANRLEITHYDVDAGKFHIIQTPFYPLQCLNRASMNLNVPVMKIYMRLRATLKRTDGLGELIYFIKDYEIDKQQGNLADIPVDISSSVNAIPPYANYTISPNVNSILDINTGNVSGVRQDIPIAYNNAPGPYNGNTTFSSPIELKANLSISTSTNYYTPTFSNNYTTVSSTRPTVIFRAGSSVTLNPKFEATYGSIFLATVDWGYMAAPCYPTAAITSYAYIGNCYATNIIAQRKKPNSLIHENNVVANENIYPNPTSGVLNIVLNTLGKIKNVTITDISGNIRNMAYLMANENLLQINISSLRSGVYVARIYTEKSVKEYKFVVFK